MDGVAAPGVPVENDPLRTITASKSRSAATPDPMLANPLCCRPG
jgi:hypothetical protein